MIDEMHRREPEPTEEVLSNENSKAVSSAEPPPAYIPACGALCDAFWWARRGSDREKSSD
jgi:hypothetical protein